MLADTGDRLGGGARQIAGAVVNCDACYCCDFFLRRVLMGTRTRRGVSLQFSK